MRKQKGESVFAAFSKAERGGFDSRRDRKVNPKKGLSQKYGDSPNYFKFTSKFKSAKI